MNTELSRPLVALLLGGILGGCSSLPGDLPAKAIREEPSAPQLRAELVGKFDLGGPGESRSFTADPRNVVLRGDVLSVLYGEAARDRAVSVNVASGALLGDSPLFGEPRLGGLLRVRKGQPVLLWDSENPSVAPSCPFLRYERLSRPAGSEGWIQPEVLGPFTVWSNSKNLGKLVSPAEIRIETDAGTGVTPALFKPSLACNQWDACLKGGQLWITDGSARDAVEVLMFDRSGLKGRFPTVLRLEAPRIYTVGDSVAVVGRGEGDQVDVFDPAQPARRLGLAARSFASGTDGRRLFICGDSLDGKGPFLCLGTLDSDAWRFARLDPGFSPANGFFIASGQDKIVFGWISGRALVVFRVSLP